MNAYFFPISNQDREDILAKHRELYNGYQTLNPAAVNKEQPLYTQDFANDKMGMVVNNKGEVKEYTNMGINESVEEVVTEETKTCPCGCEIGKCKCGPECKKCDCGRKKLDEQVETCEQCGGQLTEGMCNECGYGGSLEEMYADDMDISDEEGAYDFESDGPVDVYGTMQDYDNATDSYHPIDSMKDVEEYDDSSDINDMFGDLLDGLAFNDDYPSDTFQHDAGDIDREGDGDLGMDTENDMDLSKVKPAYTFVSGGADDPYDEDGDIAEEVDDDLRESFQEKRNLVKEMFERMSKF